MPKLSPQEKENKAFRKPSIWIAFILFIGCTAAGLVRIFFTGDSVGVNGTRLHLQVKSGFAGCHFRSFIFDCLLYKLENGQEG